MKTTLNKIKAHDHCDRGWNAILNYVGKDCGYDDPIPMNKVLDAVGLLGAIWCLRTIEGAEQEKQEFLEFCANGATQEEITIKFLELFGD